MRAPLFIAALWSCMAVAYGQGDSSVIQNLQEQVKAQPRSSLAHYQLAEAFLQQKNYTAAANEFREALNGDLQPPWVGVSSHLGLASIFDLTGQHDRAVNEYRLAIQTGDGTGAAQQIAQDNPKQEAIQSDDPPLTAPAAFRKYRTPIGPEPVQQTEPEYSEEARAAGLEGTVFVEAAISADGTPFDLQVISPLGLGLDEKAIDAVKQWRFTPPAPAVLPSAIIAVNFLLPSKLSRWHLVGASFDPPEGVSRPIFLTEPYPLGAGVSRKAIDEGWVISAIPRAATVTLRFDVDEDGVPQNFQVFAASAPVWGDEAIAVLSHWRFTPGAKDGVPVSVPCTLDLVWSQKVWTGETLAQMRSKLSTAEPVRSSPPAKATITTVYIIESSTPQSVYSVVVSAIIGDDGVPGNAHIVRSFTPEYDAQALDAVRNAHFNPPLLNGRPVVLPALIEVDFRASQ